MEEQEEVVGEFVVAEIGGAWGGKWWLQVVEELPRVRTSPV